MTIYLADIYPPQARGLNRKSAAKVTEPDYKEYDAESAVNALKQNVQMYSLGGLRSNHYLLILVGLLILIGYLQQRG